jgi:hypothetical protein
MAVDVEVHQKIGAPDLKNVDDERVIDNCGADGNWRSNWEMGWWWVGDLAGG